MSERADNAAENKKAHNDESRRLKRRAALYLAVGTVLIIAGLCVMRYKGEEDKINSPKSAQLYAMDAPCTIKMYGDGDISAVKNCITRLDGLLNAYDENSEVYKLNEFSTGELSEDTKALTEKSLQLCEKYGEVDPTMGRVIDLWDINGEDPKVPAQKDIDSALETVGTENVSIDEKSCTLSNGAKLDFGASGKGFALDKVKEELEKDKNVSCAVVSFGSSTLLYGEKPDGSDFKVSIKDPENSSDIMLDLTCGAGYVSTSGGYERYFEADGKRYIHILDRETGFPVESDLTSVTVICESGILSDFLSTRIFIGGTKEIERWLGEDDITVIAADSKGNVYCSEDIKDSIELKSSFYTLN